MSKASAAMQEYLAEAYRIAYYQDNDPYISTSSLANVMNVTAPAVTRMVQRMKEAGYLQHEPYHGIKLTQKGEREALMNIRSHRLVECFLVDIMGFGWHEVHDSADELGAVVSVMLVNRMAEMAGYPKRCPHGEPIPTADGYMPRIVDYPLQAVEVDKEYIVSRVNTHDTDKLRYFDTLGIKPGATLHFAHQAPFNGPLQIKLTKEAVHLGHELAGVLRVCSQEEFELV
ncbi:MAG: metal-dependent transcriptional regulator [Anaerolineae bacterium]|nr:metal-dependent transcriptional regulator [Anaerolineae bacterium]MDQ7033866.1 metal-dependent transcriptional regulator [Anaerolineae bacterium]